MKSYLEKLYLNKFEVDSYWEILIMKKNNSFAARESIFRREFAHSRFRDLIVPNP